MTKKSPWRPALGIGLILGVLLALVVPGVAFADPPSVTVQTPGPTPGPTTANSELKTRAGCSSGLISGGGINQTIGTGGSSNGLRAIGTVPSADGTTEFLGTPGVVATDVTHWLEIGGTGGAVNPDFSTTPYALCLTSDLINHTQVVMNKTPGPTTASTVNLVVATCPANTVLLGGGARTTPASVGSLKPIASFPTFNDSAHSFGKIAAADGETNPDSWAAAGWNGGGGDNGNTTYAYAICSGDGIDVSGVTATVRFSEVPGPTVSTTGQSATVGCGSGDGALTSGGAAISGGNVTTTDFNQAGPGSPGDHLNGSFPSDSSGNPVSDGTTTAASWTAFTHTGGQDSPNTFTDVWALCVNTTPTPGATATTTTLRVIPNPAFQGVPVFLLATVAPANAAGTVQFMDGTIALGAPVRVIGGRAPFVALRLARGTHSLTAVFTPSNPAAFGPSTSPPVPLTVRSIF